MSKNNENLSGLVAFGAEENYPELYGALVSETTSADTLFETAQQLLVYDGVKSSVNGLPATVSLSYALIEFSGVEYRARIAQYVSAKHRKAVGDASLKAMIVFSSDKETTVKTPNPRAINFRELNGDMSVVVDNDLNPLVNDLRYLHLVSEILQKVTDMYELTPKVERDRRQNVAKYIAKHANPLKLLHDYFHSSANTPKNSFFQSKGNRRQFIRGFIVATGLLYSHMPFGNEDATVGNFPLFAPAEFIVDLANAPDHTAQSFDLPVGAQELTLGDAPVPVPLLIEYDTSGAPDSTFYTQTNGDVRNESKLGLYEMDIPEDYYEKGSEITLLNEETGCYDVHAKTTGGKTLVFTQSPHLVGRITVQAVTEDKLEVCAVAGVNIESLEQGSVFIYQRMDEK